jgi:hypothetical protein
MMQEICWIIWSSDPYGRVMGHLCIEIPVGEWCALADWCWEEDRREQFRRLVSLGTGDPPSVLDAKAVRELQKEVLARPSEPYPQAITSALDALVPFLEEAIRVVDRYAGTPYTVIIEFRRGQLKRGTVWYWV